jgi:hypothetical protein
MGRRVGEYLDGGRISQYQAIGLITGLCGAVSVEAAPYGSLTGVTLGLFGIRQDARMQTAIRHGCLLVAERETAAPGRVSRRDSAVSAALDDLFEPAEGGMPHELPDITTTLAFS